MSKYEEYCATDSQAQIMQQYELSGSASSAAEALGMDGGYVRKTVRRVKERAAREGMSDRAQIDLPAPEGYMVPFSTVHYKEGEQVQAWMRYKPDEQKRLQAINMAVENSMEGIKPFENVPAPKKITIEDDLCTDYVFTDFHLGMYAWSKECGSDWDIHIAEQTFLQALNDLMDRSPNSKVAIFSQMGDFLHWDGLLAVTPQSQHVVDADTRYDMLVELAMRITAKAVEMLLQKHEKVIDIQMEGNHDISGSIWLRKHHKIMFQDNPRVEVNDSVAPYYGYTWGENFLGWHHGHKLNNKKVAEFFSSSPKFRQAWGNAKQTYIKTGHLHHGEALLECNGAWVERFPTLAAKDSFAARGGWNSFRSTKAVTYHKTQGQWCSCDTKAFDVREEYY
jgi:hypothetical protein